MLTQYRRSQTDVRGKALKMQELQDTLQRAIQDHKVFMTSKGSSSQVMQRCLRKRLFVRKLDPSQGHISRIKNKNKITLESGHNDSDNDNKSSDNENNSVHSDDDSESVIEYMVIHT